MNVSNVLYFADCSIRVYQSFAATCRNIAINPFYIINFISYYASIMLNVFSDPLCSKLCWHNRRVLIYIAMYI